MAVFTRSSEQDSPRSQDTGTRPLTATGQRASAPGPVDRSVVSVIGRDLTIMGQQITIVSQGTLQVDGNVRGDLRGKEIIVGETGKVNGTVSAESVQIRGEVSGAIRALSVVLHPSSRVEGDIHHQTLAISEGASFDGRVRRPKDTIELTPILDIATISSGEGGQAGT